MKQMPSSPMLCCRVYVHKFNYHVRNKRLAQYYDAEVMCETESECNLPSACDISQNVQRLPGYWMLWCRAHVHKSTQYIDSKRLAQCYDAEVMSIISIRFTHNKCLACDAEVMCETIEADLIEMVKNDLTVRKLISSVNNQGATRIRLENEQAKTKRGNSPGHTDDFLRDSGGNGSRQDFFATPDIPGAEHK